MSSFSSFLAGFGFKSNPNDEYTKNTLTIIEEAIKVERLLKSYIDQQRIFTDSLVEWTASKEPTNKTLSDLARILSQINFEWTKSQEVFRESISRVRHEFEIIATDLGDKEYFESRYESARKELESHNKKKKGRQNESETMKLEAKEQRKQRDLKEYHANRENRTLVKVKRSFSGLAYGFMHQGASSFNIYQAFETALCNLLPDEEFNLTPIILKPSDYLAISEGRAESSLAIEREISRSRASSTARSSYSVDRHRRAIACESCHDKPSSPMAISAQEHVTQQSLTQDKANDNKQKKKHSKRGKSQVDGSTSQVDLSKSRIDDKSKPTTPEQYHEKVVEKLEEPMKEAEDAEKSAETPVSISGTVRSSSIEDSSSIPSSLGFDEEDQKTTKKDDQKSKSPLETYSDLLNFKSGPTKEKSPTKVNSLSELNSPVDAVKPSP